MITPLAPLFLALCINDKSWVAEMTAPREPFTPSSLQVAFCRSQLALHKAYDKDTGKNITCNDAVEPKNIGQGSTMALAHNDAVGACIINHCEGLKANTDKFTADELEGIRAMLYNSGKTKDEIEQSIKAIEANPSPKRHDCLENSKDGYLASALAWDFCVNRPYQCDETKEK